MADLYTIVDVTVWDGARQERTDSLLGHDGPQRLGNERDLCFMKSNVREKNTHRNKF